ncbi:MAG: trypsin-like serine protease [Burkholderiales bacterium]
MKQLFAAAALALAAVVPATPALAITDGELDGERHPYVGLLVFDIDGAPAWRCSGTLLSPTILLTAGHCTSGATGGRVWFASNVQTNPEYPFAGSTSVEFDIIKTHPLFTDAAFFLHDVGMVKLKSAVPLATYGELPQVNLLDTLRKQDVTFTSVGYGLQKSFPDAAAWKDVRMKIRMLATPKLIQINVPGATGDFSMLLSNNAHTGGTCFGDSGGPNFLGSSNLVAGVTSYGKNGTCGGTGGVFRLDRQNVLDFIAGFRAAYGP